MLADDALRHGVTILYPSRTFAMLLGPEVGPTAIAESGNVSIRRALSEWVLVTSY